MTPPAAATAPVRSPRRELGLPLAVLLVTLLIVGVTAIGAFRIVPEVIGQAYRGESFPVLNRVIRGQAIHPVEYYLGLWERFGRGLLTAELSVGVLVGLLVWPPFQRLVDQRVGPATRGPALTRFGMTTRRRLAVGLLLAVVIGLQLVDIAIQREHWPFSHYGMYSDEHAGTMSWHYVYGVTPAGEFRLVPERHLRPFDVTRLPYGIEDRVLTQPDPAAGAREALRSLHELYEIGRRAGDHTGPPLEALRLYRVEWRLDPSLSNKHAPERRRLVHELRLSR